MNYQIVPFTYLNRDSGIRAVLKSERILAIPTNRAGGNGVAGVYGATGLSSPYKNNYSGNSSGAASTGPPYGTDWRHDINPTETLKGFQARFAAKDIFRSASEICTLDLVPADTPADASGATYSSDGSTMRSFWQAHALTGDNTREKPYADIYPRLTTKSNTFTVHLRVQTLKKSIASDPTTWNGNTDTIASEYRGAQTIERYVDPNDPNLPDYVVPSTSGPLTSLDSLYKFRVLNVKQFTP